MKVLNLMQCIHGFYSAVSWWRHQMETFSVLLDLCGPNPDSHQKGQWRGSLMFSLINSWANNRDAGDLRLHRAHYDVNVMVDDTLRYMSSSSHRHSSMDALKKAKWTGFISSPRLICILYMSSCWQNVGHRLHPKLSTHRWNLQVSAGSSNHSKRPDYIVLSCRQVTPILSCRQVTPIRFKRGYPLEDGYQCNSPS